MYTWLTTNKIFNLEYIGDVILSVELAEVNPFLNEQSRKYFRFIAREQGLNGLFQFRSPREYIEGFEDPLLVQLSQMPVYMGGDICQPTLMSLNNPPTTPVNNSIWLMTGSDDYMDTRKFSKWADVDYSSVKRKVYTSLTQTKEINDNPW
jgi:hypothetical protein